MSVCLRLLMLTWLTAFMKLVLVQLVGRLAELLKCFLNRCGLKLVKWAVLHLRAVLTLCLILVRWWCLEGARVTSVRPPCAEFLSCRRVRRLVKRVRTSSAVCGSACLLMCDLVMCMVGLN